MVRFQLGRTLFSSFLNIIFKDLFKVGPVKKYYRGIQAGLNDQSRGTLS